MNPHILLLFATDRGVRSLEKVVQLVPDADLTVCCFKEEPWEPPFQDRMRSITVSVGGRFIPTRDASEAFATVDEHYDLLLAVNWRSMVSDDVRDRLNDRAFVFHDSLLPRYRGFSPTVWSMINGDTETGATLFQMVGPVDGGPIIDQLSVTIPVGAYISEVLEHVTEAYLELIERNLTSLLRGSEVQRIQSEDKASYTCKRLPSDNKLDWRYGAKRIVDLVHAVAKPYTGAYCILGERKIIIWRASLPKDPPKVVGSIAGRPIPVSAEGGVFVMAGDGPVLIEEVQVDGEPSRPAIEVLRGRSFQML